MAQSPPRVAIVGGGIGGLFAANALTAQGITVSVYEQAPAIGEIGAGVFLTPNSVRHLHRIGLQGAVEKWGARVGRNSHYFRHDGAPIAPVQVTDASGWNATFGMHRADLVDMLAAALPPGTVHAGHRCSGFEQDGDTARVKFANGASAEADIVIAADGIHSEFDHMCFRPRSRCSMARSPIAGWCRMSGCRIGRPTAGRCGSAPDGTSSPFPCAPAN